MDRSRLVERVARMAEVSLAEQRKMEAADTVPFETVRQQYLAALPKTPI